MTFIRNNCQFHLSMVTICSYIDRCTKSLWTEPTYLKIVHFFVSRLTIVNTIIGFETRKYSFMEKRSTAELRIVVPRLQNLEYTEAGGILCNTKTIAGSGNK